MDSGFGKKCVFMSIPGFTAGASLSEPKGSTKAANHERGISPLGIGSFEGKGEIVPQFFCCVSFPKLRLVVCGDCIWV
jgi:hypothetical protein